MNEPARAPSPRQSELLELAYKYVLQHGLADLSLRPLAGSIGSSPRRAVVPVRLQRWARSRSARARPCRRACLVGPCPPGQEAWRTGRHRKNNVGLAGRRGTPSVAGPVGASLRSFAHRTRRAWAGFARQTVEDWLGVLATGQPANLRRTAAGAAECSLALAVLRGSLLDLLATGDRDRTTAAVQRHLSQSASTS